MVQRGTGSGCSLVEASSTGTELDSVALIHVLADLRAALEQDFDSRQQTTASSGSIADFRTDLIQFQGTIRRMVDSLDFETMAEVAVRNLVLMEPQLHLRHRNHRMEREHHDRIRSCPIAIAMAVSRDSSAAFDHESEDCVVPIVVDTVHVHTDQNRTEDERGTGIQRNCDLLQKMLLSVKLVNFP